MDFDALQVKKMLVHVADVVMENKPYLTEIDSKIGDGDHGIGMHGGMSKAKDKLLSMDELDDVNKCFLEMGKTMLMSMGGASGVIFGTMFMGGSKNQIAANKLSMELFASIMEGGLIAIKERGKASVGDKTMVDALEPAVIGMKAYKGNSLLELLKIAEEESFKGVENTKKYVAKFGRAKSLGERAIGFQDAGATSVYLIFKAMREYAESNEVCQ